MAEEEIPASQPENPENSPTEEKGSDQEKETPMKKTPKSKAKVAAKSKAKIPKGTIMKKPSKAPVTPKTTKSEPSAPVKPSKPEEPSYEETSHVMKRPATKKEEPERKQRSQVHLKYQIFSSRSKSTGPVGKHEQYCTSKGLTPLKSQGSNS